jgi:transcriptional regulator with XRE-family HTH domain
MSRENAMRTQDAVKKLRESLGLSQEEFAQKVGVTVRTIARYENDLPPKGAALARLHLFANDAGQTAVAKAFESEMGREQNQRVAQKIRGFLREAYLWQQIGLSLEKLIAESENIRPSDVRKRIEDELNQLGKNLAEQKTLTARARR